MKNKIIIILFVFVFLLISCLSISKEEREIKKFSFEDFNVFFNIHDAKIPINNNAEFIHVWIEKYEGKNLPDDSRKLKNKNIKPKEIQRISSYYLNIYPNANYFLFAIVGRFSLQNKNILTGISKDDGYGGIINSNINLDSDYNEATWLGLKFVDHNLNICNHFYSAYWHDEENINEIKKIAVFKFMFSDKNFDDIMAENN